MVVVVVFVQVYGRGHVMAVDRVDQNRFVTPSCANQSMICERAAHEVGGRDVTPMPGSPPR